MRKLTQKEINQAPDWATHYYLIKDRGNIIFESAEFYSNYNPHTNTRYDREPQMSCGMSNRSKLIRPPKDFHISDFWKEGTYSVTTDGNVKNDLITINGKMPMVCIDDAIALAKHFNLTASDLS